MEERERARRIVFSGLLIGIAYSLIYVVMYGGFPRFSYDDLHL